MTFYIFICTKFDGHLRHSNPIITKAATTGAIFGGGDILAQYITNDSDSEILPQRAVVTALYGLFLQGPALHVWYRSLERYWPGETAKAIAKKILAQHVVYAPINICCFNAWTGYFNGVTSNGSTPLENAFINTIAKGPSLWMDGNLFWGPLNVLIFSVVPLPYRPVVSNCGNVVWSTYMSYRANECFQPQDTWLGLAIEKEDLADS